MTSADFNKIVEAETERIKSVLIKKQAEYNLTDDRFDSFKHGAGITGWTPEQVLLGYLTKHIASIIEMINSKKSFPKELWEEKIGDYLNYGLLLRGLIEDQNKFSE